MMFGLFGWLSVATLGIVAVWTIGAFISDFAKETGTVWERALKASRNSATFVWTKLMAVGTSLFGVLVYGADILGMPDVSAQLNKVLTPEVMTWIGVVVAVVTALARLRTAQPK